MNKSIYNISGKEKLSLNGVSVKKFVKNLVDNRVLDVYLKYMGIKLLSTASMVPFALILGSSMFENSVKEIISNDQKGGGNLIPKNIPVLDDKLLGNYLKLMGVTTLSILPQTLLPLGVLMIVYSMFLRTQSGGRVTMPSKYFNPTNNETYVNELPPTIGNSFPNPPTRVTQKGGRVTMPSKYFNPTNNETYVNEVPQTIGNSWPNPPNRVVQNITTGQTGAGLLRGLPEYNNELQVASEITPTLNTVPTIPVVPQDTGYVHGYNVHPTGKMSGGGCCDEGCCEGCCKGDKCSACRGGGKHKKGGGKHKKSLYNIEGGGSDWLGTLYSSGPVNYPDMNPSQFRSFTNTAEYKPNSELNQIYAEY